MAPHFGNVGALAIKAYTHQLNLGGENHAANVRSMQQFHVRGYQLGRGQLEVLHDGVDGTLIANAIVVVSFDDGK